jgi:hypothetical protein
VQHTPHTAFSRIMPDQDQWDDDAVDYDTHETFDEEYDDNDNEMGPERSYFE